MMETKSTWKDAGYDCDHCGGVILQRTDEVPGRPLHDYYECRRCSCQWALNGERMRIGQQPQCQAATPAAAPQLPQLPGQLTWRNLWLGAAGLLMLFLLLRVAGGLLIRLLIPALFVVIAVAIIVWMGRREEWW